MKITYDHKADALYIELTSNVTLSTRKADATTFYHLDEQDEVAAIEIIAVRKRGIDPLSLLVEHVTPDRVAERPTKEAMAARRAEVDAARQRKRDRAAQKV
jgi:uncharacterized protein YuzE